MRIDTLSSNNRQMQGAQRRAWLQQYAPQHLQHCTQLIQDGLALRAAATSQSSLVLGAGACTEVPLAALARLSEEVVLADLDLAALQRGRDELTSPALRKIVRFVQCDLTGGVSTNLSRYTKKLDWKVLGSQGAVAVFDAAADCLEQCRIPDPPAIYTLHPGDFGCIVSSLVLSQLVSYPLLDLLDTIQSSVPALLADQERHRRYQEAAQAFRMRIINAHLHFLYSLLDTDGSIVLLSDIRGFAFSFYGTDHDAEHRRLLPLLPRSFPELISATFRIIKEQQWEWLTDLPDDSRPGRGYEVSGYILQRF